MKSYEYYEEEDIILEPKPTKQQKKRDAEEEWYHPLEEREYRYKPVPRMGYQKKRDLEEYNLQRKQFDVEQKAQQEARKHLELHDIPRDIIEDILTRAGFYIPRVCIFRK